MIYFHLPYKMTCERAVQSFMAKNQRSLFVKGLLYPSSCLESQGHDPLYTELKSKGVDRDFSNCMATLVGNLRNYKTRNGRSDVLMSSARMTHLDLDNWYRLI